MADVLHITVLLDGTIRIKTGAISDANHLSAEQMLDGITTVAGGEVTTEANHERDLLGHHHHHDHQTERQ